MSLCACRILKIRSCLRRPLALGRSRARAILVSSVIFFSFSSAIVIFTYGVLDWIRKATPEIKGGNAFPSVFFPRTRQPDWPGGDKEALLCGPALWFRNYCPGLGHYRLLLGRLADKRQN